MPRARVAVAAGSAPGARAAAEVARAGGNAVDACLAAAVMAWVAEPFYASLGGSGFVTVGLPGGVEVVDGNNAMPATPPGEPGQGVRRVHLAGYADGLHTGVGGGSVAVPGILAAVHRAWERHGSVEWDALLAPAVEAARKGLPLPRTSARYLAVTWEALWFAFPQAAATFGRDGRPLAEGELLVQPELAEALELVSARGPEALYGGELGAALVEAVRADGGLLTVEDLGSYQAVVRDPLRAAAWGWEVHTNPPPALGGAALARMLAVLSTADLGDPRQRARALVAAQRSAAATGRAPDPGGLAGPAPSAPAPSRRSPATTHCSAADSDGRVCAVTESCGYGSGLVVQGVVLNNTLGEEELNPAGIHALAPGVRCPSNMAPTVAFGPQTTVALGSPGAERIPGAVVQVLLRLAVDGASLEDAVAAPRLHLAAGPDGQVLHHEPGIPAGAVPSVRARPYEGAHMYFGAVQAASCDAGGRVAAAHDPRRSGASVVV